MQKCTFFAKVCTLCSSGIYQANPFVVEFSKSAIKRRKEEERGWNLLWQNELSP
jgi:hypothetical protein